MNEKSDIVAELERLNRLYDALRLVSHAIVHSKNEEELFLATCRLVVECGKFKMAYLGVYEPERGVINPSCNWGDTTGYIDQLILKTHGSLDELGPGATSFCTDTNYITQDFFNDPKTVQWRDRAKVAGIRASATIPIHRNKKPYGILSVYSEQVGYFQAEEVALLVETAADISFALDRFDEEKKRLDAETELRRYEAIVRSSKDAIVSRTIDGKIITWNEAAERMFGYIADEMIGQSINKYVPEGRRQQFSAWHQRLLDNGQISEVETERLHKNGSLVRVSLVGSPILDADGQVNGVVASMRDLSEQKQVSEQIDQFFNNWNDYLCVMNSEGYFERISSSFSEMLGWTIEELRSKPFMELVLPSDIEKTVRVISEMIEQPNVPFELENSGFTKDGGTKTLSWKAIALSNGKIYASARDVTELRKAQNDIEELNKNLKLRSEQLEWAKAEAVRANRTKSEFLSRMSHELRTPLNSVLGFAQILEMRSNDTGVLDCTTAILKAGRHLLELINEVLDISRIETGRLECHFDAIPVGEVLKQAIELVKTSADEKSISISLDQCFDESIVHADRTRLLQILLNLLSNAIKFNRENGSINIRCSDCSTSVCRIEVSDSGFGVGDEPEKWLFRPFERGPNANAPGTGLGLALSLSLANHMGGNLYLKHSTPEGSAFVLELNRLPSVSNGLEEDSKPTPLSSSPSLTVHQVLYIEDNLTNLKLMREFVNRFESISLIDAATGQEGLRKIEADRPDLILLDLHLPDITGPDLLNKIKNSEKTCKIPVIMVSADATDESIKQCLQAGAEAYITKPINFSELMAEINRLLPNQSH